MNDDEPIRSPQNFPVALTPLIGRDRELTEIADLLRRPGVRLVTLLGAGGVGKTRVAAELASTFARDPDWAVRFAPLAEVRDRALVLPAVAGALGIWEAGDRSLAEQIAAGVGADPTLLVLDNFEQVIAAAADLSALLGRCPALRLLVTSRALLRVSGETAYALSPLAVPAGERHATPAELAENPAVRLFVERAQAVAPGFTLDADTAPAVAEICRRLDGLPLAIELAAARSTLLSPAELLGRLGSGGVLRFAGTRDAHRRQRTMRDAIAWSYGLLAPDERAFFRRLGAFTGSFTLAAAARVADEPSEDVALERLGALVDHSLVGASTDRSGSTRYAMLAVVREFAREELAAAGEADAARDRHAAYFVALTATAEGNLLSPTAAGILRLLDDEMPNVRGALDRLDEAGRHGEYVRACLALRLYWWYRSSRAEVRERIERALALSAEWRTEARGWVLVAAAEQAGDRGERELERALLDEALACLRAHGDPLAEAWGLHFRGIAAWGRDDLDLAEEVFGQSLRIQRAHPETYRLGSTLNQLGIVALLRGEPALAADRLGEALVANRQSGNPNELGISLSTLGFVRHGQGRQREAAGLLAEALAVNLALDFRSQLTWCLSFAARVAVAFDAPERAARLFGAESALRDAVGVPIPERQLPGYRQAVDTTRMLLGDRAFATAWGAGGALPWREAVEEAIGLARGFAEGPPGVRPTAAAGYGALTGREAEVLPYLVAGRTNREIADALAISPRTVGNHVASILAKLGVASRRDVRRLALGAASPPHRDPAA